MSFHQYDMVRLVNGVPEDGIPAGATAVILDVYEEPELHYEVEVQMDDEDELYTMGVAPEEIEPAG